MDSDLANVTFAYVHAQHAAGGGGNTRGNPGMCNFGRAPRA